MAKRVAGVTEKLMEAAKQEFLKMDMSEPPYRLLRKRPAPAKEQFTFATRTKRACIVPLYSLPWMIFVV